MADGLAKEPAHAVAHDRAPDTAAGHEPDSAIASRGIRVGEKPQNEKTPRKGATLLLYARKFRSTSQPRGFWETQTRALS